MRKLSEITRDLGIHYNSWKDEEKEKENNRKEFFDAATEEVKKKTLARKTIRVAEDTKEFAWEYAAKYYPKWKIIDVYEDEEAGDYLVLLEEDPELKEFVFVNHEDGLVYTKTITTGSTIVDTERIQDEDPEFWEEISEVPEERELKALEDLSHQQFVKLQKYVYQGKPQVKLSKPRRAKAEELDENNNSQ